MDISEIFSEKNQKGLSEDGLPRAIAIKSGEMLSKIARDLNFTGAENANDRRQALHKLHLVLFTEFSMSITDYNEVFRDICKTLFKRYSDPSEKCRDLSHRITQSFFEKANDFVPVLAYYFPMLMQRLPGGLAYDEEMKVFVTDIETHEAYRRGKAVERQDKTGGASGAFVHSIVEESEEIRNLSCIVLGTLLRRSIAIGASSILHPYFHEIVMYLQMQLKDPFPDLKVEACASLEILARTDEFNSGMKFFAVALVRATLPALRHRHAKVRLAAVRCVNSCIVIPDRAKVKGSGTDAIADLVGFREENVLQVSAFYTSDVQINYLAELVRDNSAAVKEGLVSMFGELMTEMGDRYDHQTRLLPYLLDLLTDESHSVSSSALAVLKRCGQQYEEEHPDEIIEKRQYGVDGNDCINLEKPLPKPFTERPRIGIRLYVRGNCKRFLNALINELTNWVSATRVKSAKLMKLIVALSEEHLTMEVHTLLPSLIKALRFAADDSEKDKDKELHVILLEIFELLGRYISPSAYLHYMLPRLRADAAVSSFGADMVTRVAVLEALQAMVEGSKPSQIIPFLSEMVATLTDSFVIDPESIRLTTAAVKLLLSILFSIQGRGQAAIEGQYLATGRLSSLRVTTGKLFTFFLSIISNPEKKQKVIKPVKLMKKAPSVTKKSSSLTVAEILALSSSDSKKKKPKSTVSKTRKESSQLAKICSVADVISLPQSSVSHDVKEPPSLHSLAVEGMNFLVCLEGGIGTVSNVCGDGSGNGMKDLMMRHGLPLLSSLMDSSRGDDSHPLPGVGTVCEGVDAADPSQSNGGDSSDGPQGYSQNIFNMEVRDLRLLICLVSSPWALPLSSPTTLSLILSLILISTRRAFLCVDTKEMEDQLITCSELLLTILVPFCYTVYPATASQMEVFSEEFFSSASALSTMVERCTAALHTEGCDNVDMRTQGDGHSQNAMDKLSSIESRSLQGVHYWTGHLNGERMDSQHVPLGGPSRTGDGWTQSAVISDIVSDHLESVLEVFVLSSIWGRSVALQEKRIEVLSMLVGYTGGSARSRFQDAVSVQSSSGYLLRQCSALRDPDSSNADEEDMTSSGRVKGQGEGEGEEIIKSRNRTIFPLINREVHAIKVVQRPLRHPSQHEYPYIALIIMFGCELFPLLSSCLDPSRREEVRLSAVEMAAHLLRILSGQLPHAAKSRTSHNDVSPILLSYAARDRLTPQNIDGMGREEFNNGYTSVCEAARGGISLAMGALSDGSDDVCAAALEVLQTAAPLILQYDVQVRDGRDDADTPVEQPTSFTGVLHRLLVEITTNSNTSTAPSSSSSTSTLNTMREVLVLDLTDSLLRRLASLDPESFVCTVRTAVDRYLGKSNSSSPDVASNCSEDSEKSDIGADARESLNPEILSILSGLLDHGDFLIVLANR